MRRIEKVLIVDDDGDFRYVLERRIRKLRNNVDLVQASHGQEALNLLNSWKDPVNTLIFLDINMPLMDGWQFLSKVVEAPSLLNDDKYFIFICSSSDNSQDLKLAADHTLVIDYLTKRNISKDLIAEVFQRVEE